MVSLAIAPSLNVAAGEPDLPRHSLIHRPPSQLSVSSPQPDPLPDTTHAPKISSTPAPSLSLHHTLKRKPATGSASPLPSKPVPAAQTFNSTRSSPLVGTAFTEPATGIQSQPAAPALIPAITTPSVPSFLGSAALPSSKASGATSPLTGSAAAGNAPSLLPRAFQRLIQANPAFATLIQPPTIAVVPSPAPPPAVPPPSTPPPAPNPPPSNPSTPTTGSATLTWSANGESDLAGYKIYVGTASGIYTYPRSPLTVGKVNGYTVTNLPSGTTYFFAISAYDSEGNESQLSAEVSKSIF